MFAPERVVLFDVVSPFGFEFWLLLHGVEPLGELAGRKWRFDWFEILRAGDAPTDK
jgi:hypothetical protein